MLSIDRTKEILSPSKNIAVLGDLMIDEYLWGKVTRISPEAPVPIVEVNEEHLRPGGSANVAKNLIGLGQNVYLFGISGNDRMGNKLKTILETEGINTDGIIDSDNRPTTVKTRIIGGSQHLARVDKENTSPISSLEEKKILIQLQNSIKNLDALVLEDYNKGVLTAPLIKKVINLCKENEVLVTVDPKFNNFFNYKDVSLFKPNKKEAQAALNYELINEEYIHKAGEDLLERLQAKSVLITLGSRGMALFNRNEQPYLLPTHARDVADVSGAGDTVISALTTVLANKGSAKEAVMVANIAAGIVCGHVGVVSTTADVIIDRVKNI